MTYEEAVIFKRNLGYDKYEKGGLEYLVYIAPENDGDFQKYLHTVFGIFAPPDSAAKNFSSNEQYSVYGIFYKKGVKSFKKIG